MIDVVTKLNTGILNDWERRLQGQLRMAVQDSLVELKVIAEEEVDQLGAYDTFAMRESLYISIWQNSTYEEAAEAAQDAYMNNPTQWPLIRQIFGDVLKLDPEIKAANANEGYLGVAAGHGKYVENGYISFFKNDVPARPVIGNTARKGFPIVMALFQAAAARAARGEAGQLTTFGGTA